ncbi:MAG TPA: allophanate hydrolase subunit 1, partial [Trueperaceae bacterium]
MAAELRAVPAGPAAFYLHLDGPPSPDLSQRLRALAASLRASQPTQVHDLVPGYTSLLVEHAPHADQMRLLAWAALATTEAGTPEPTESVTVPVRYGEAADQAELEARLGLPWAEIVRRHAAARYTVAFTGFTPGFPYLLGLPASLQLPRRDHPQADIPAGAVAIAGRQAGIYPAGGPGGWWVLGRTSAPLWEPARDPPALLETGDQVRFVPASPERVAEERSAAPAIPL